MRHPGASAKARLLTDTRVGLVGKGAAGCVRMSAKPVIGRPFASSCLTTYFPHPLCGATAKARLESRDVLDCRRCFYRETKASSRSFGGSNMVERLL